MHVYTRNSRANPTTALHIPPHNPHNPGLPAGCRYCVHGIIAPHLTSLYNRRYASLLTLGIDIPAPISGGNHFHQTVSSLRRGRSSEMSIPILTLPPPERTNYIIDQFEGERLTIPGSKGTFRILASSKQTNGGIAVFQSAAVLSDAPGFHWHAEAHDVFLPTKGFLKLWNGDKCRIMGPGDFAYIPPVSVAPVDSCTKLANPWS